MISLYYESSISHHGIRGQKWGVRRFQNPDGSLTKRGKLHQMNKEASEERGRQIATDKAKHFGKDVAETAGVNIGATMARQTVEDLHDTLAKTAKSLPYLDKYANSADVVARTMGIESVMKMGMTALSDATQYITVGQVAYNAFKGVKLVRDIIDYNRYKKSRFEKEE